MVHLAVSNEMVLPDVHNRPDERQIAIDHVGVSEVRFPITVLDRDGEKQSTIARLNMSVDLPHDSKGTHMSRFIEVLNKYFGEVSIHTLPRILVLMKERLGSERARVEISFPFFIKRVAPASGEVSLLDYDCKFVAEINSVKDDYSLTVSVPVTALCPCSKEISDYGAHNQRSFVTITAKSVREESGRPLPIYISDLVEVAEGAASAPIYPLLKRVDERHVTMQAYDHPVFVEDAVRDVAIKLIADERIARFRVHVENHESIHTHNAFACIEWDRLTDESLRL